VTRVHRTVTGGAAVREAVGLILLEVIAVVAGVAIFSLSAVKLVVGAAGFAALVAIVYLSVSFDDEASGASMPGPLSGPADPGAEGNRFCAGGLQRPPW
jgi:hypothetical protein